MTAPTRSRLVLPTIALLTALLTLLGGALPASAASDDLRYDGQKLNMARVPATTVKIDAYSVTRAGSAVYSVDGRVLGTDTTLDLQDGRWHASTSVDLTGLHGVTQLTVRFVDGGSSRRVWRYFRAIPVATSAPSAGAVARKGPEPSATGVPAGTRLTPSGPLDIREPGTVVDGLDVTGCITVRAPAVVIRNTRVRCDRPVGLVAVRVQSGGRGLVLESVEVDGLGTSQVCVGYGGYTLRRVNLHGCNDGARFGSDVTIEDSWVHGLKRIAGLHPDALQTTGGQDVVVRRNRLEAQGPKGSGTFNNAALMMGSELSPGVLDRVLVESNHLDGGNFALNVRGDVNAGSITFRNNTFGDTTRYGPVITPTRVPLGAGNVYAATGGAVQVVAAP